MWGRRRLGRPRTKRWCGRRWMRKKHSARKQSAISTQQSAKTKIKIKGLLPQRTQRTQRTGNKIKINTNTQINTKPKTKPLKHRGTEEAEDRKIYRGWTRMSAD